MISISFAADQDFDPYLGPSDTLERIQEISLRYNYFTHPVTVEIGDVTLLDAIPIPLLDFVPGLLKAACQVKRSANAKISFTEHEEYIDLEPAGDCLIISFGPDLQVECSRGEFILEAVRFSEEAFWHLVNIHPELRRNPFVVSISQLLESGL